MIQFTTTNVINSTLELSTGLPLWSLQEAGEDTTLFIKRVGNFKKKNVTAIYKRAAQEPENAKITFDLSTLETANGAAKKGDVFQINVFIGLTEGSNFSLYANDFYYKGKPFIVEFAYDGNATTTAKTLVKTIKNFLLDTQYEKMVNVTEEGGKVIIEAVNGYQRFINPKIEWFNPEAYSHIGDFETVVEATLSETGEGSNEYRQGKEGFGTYEFILHNLRIPTNSRTGFMAVNQEENPVPGATYTQFTIHMCTERGTLGLNAVGDQVTSHTTHVLYVNDALLEKTPTGKTPDGFTTSTFESMLAQLVDEIEEVVDKED